LLFEQEPPKDWTKSLAPLFKKYDGRKHPLNHANKYQLVVAVILSARSSDALINKIAPAFFKVFPSMKELSRAKPETLFPYLREVMNFENKANWLIAIAKTVKEDSNIPSTLEELVKLPGIGRKSANVIIGESGGKAEGVIVDLHVIRVAPRIGIAKSSRPEKIEQEIMAAVSQEYWHVAGMSMTFLGREICRPTNPHCPECVVNKVCEYYKQTQGIKGAK